MNLAQQTQVIKDTVLANGFDKVGIAKPDPAKHYQDYLNWVAQGHAGNMHYMQEETRKRKRRSVLDVMPTAKSVLMASMNYKPDEKLAKSTGKIARYAWGRDYHKVLKKKFKQAIHDLQGKYGLDFDYKIYVDTGPILERDYAVQAGLGWIGKNTCLIDTKLGSYTLLGCVLLDLELKPDPPMLKNHCGTCTRCLDACPTQAFEAPYQLNARKCISYHTIENRYETIPNDIAKQLNGWLIGCDICQEVCPWNRKAPNHQQEAFKPRQHTKLSIQSILAMDDQTFTKNFAGTSLYRTGLKTIQDTAHQL